MTLYGFSWKPYSLRSGEEYLFAYTETFRGERREGRFLIKVRRTKRGYRVYIEGRYHRWEGSLEETFENAVKIADYILVKMYFQHWLIPLGRTLFLRGAVRALGTSETDWTFGERELEDGVIRRVVPCRVLGFEGRMLEVEKRGKAVFRVCVHPDVPLPLYMLRTGGEGNRFEIKAIRYSSEERDPEGSGQEAEEEAQGY
ncbi:MAG: hypothetical protein Q9N26_06270 [Aquificota bacterium]|nr:hypothetical protein [Aquificota bacterium]